MKEKIRNEHRFSGRYRLTGLAWLMVVMLWVSSWPVQAAPVEGINEKATKLNNLGILRGDGRSFKLNESLKREQAAAFNVRLLGAESDVLAKRSQYLNFPFSDVNAGKDWSAPYVGYCIKQGIINGYTDNTFRPKGVLSRQAFLKTLLVALGYKYNDEFNWDTVFAKAKLIGLINQAEYQRGDQGTFTRGEVVEFIDRALKMKNAKTGQVMAMQLLKDKKVTKEMLAKEGYIVKEGANQVLAFKQLSGNKYSLVLSDIPQNLTKKLIQVTDDTDHPMAIEAIEKTDLQKVFTVKINGLKQGQVYQVRISGLMDSQGFLMKDYQTKVLMNQLTGLDSYYFRIKQVNPVSTDAIDVRFTHPISQAVEQATAYRLLEDDRVVFQGEADKLTFGRVGQDKVRLTFKGIKFKPEALYQLEIEGSVQSAYLVHLNRGEGDQAVFKADNVVDRPFAVEAIETPDKYSLRLIVNKPVNQTIAEQVFSYYLTDANQQPIAISSVTVMQEGALYGVLLKTKSALVENRAYNLKINRLPAVGDSEEILLKDYPLTARFIGRLSYDLGQVSHYDPYTLELMFNIPMDKASVEKPANYHLRGKTVGFYAEPKAVYYDQTSNSAWLYFDKRIRSTANATYTLTTDTAIKGAAGEERDKRGEVDFTAGDLDVQQVALKEVVYLGENISLVTLTEPIALAVPNVLPGNYTIREIESQNPRVITGVHYIDPTHLILIAEDMKAGTQYELKVNQLLEYNGTTLVEQPQTMDIHNPVGESRTTH